MPGRTIVIKKYENRRLYDSTNSRYVNLEEIAQMVREGDNIQVLDAATGEDLTRLILTQIIAEDAKASDSSFPIDVLRQMVMASGQASREGLMGYMKAMSDLYQNTVRSFIPPNPFESTPPPSHTNAEFDELRRRIEELERQTATPRPKRKPK